MTHHNAEAGSPPDDKTVADTVALIPPTTSAAQQESTHELAYKRYQHALKADKVRARCCRFFCVFGLFFGLCFLLAVPLSWWQSFVCSPPPSVFEGSVLGIELKGQGHFFVNLWPEDERIFYGRMNDVVSVEYQRRYEGVAAYDEARNLLFWAVSKCMDCKYPNDSAHGIYVYSRDGVRSKQVIDIGDMQIQSLAVDSFHPRTGSWRLYAILNNGKIMAYDEPTGWFTFAEVKETKLMWNFAYVNAKLRVLYLGAFDTTGQPIILQHSLDGHKNSEIVTYSLGNYTRYNNNGIVYDAEQNTFVWLEIEGENTVSIRRYQPGAAPDRFQQFNYAPAEVVTALKSVHKLAYDYVNSRFYLLDPYALKIIVIEFDHQSIVSVNSYRTQCASPLYLRYVSPIQV